jgi:hypothetical protein
MHQNDRRFCSRVIPDVDPMVVPLYKSLLVDHHSLWKECRPTCISDDPQKTPLRPQNAPDTDATHKGLRRTIQVHVGKAAWTAPFLAAICSKAAFSACKQSV